MVSSNTSACMGLNAETLSFFKTLIEEINNVQIIAKVRIVSTKIESIKRITKADVVLAVSQNCHTIL